MTPKMLRHWRISLLVLMAACTTSGAQTPAATEPSAPPDFLRSHMDFKVDPGVDFFSYANGDWLARNPIPAAESWWGIGSLVNEQLYSSLRTINENAAAAAPPAGSELQKNRRLLDHCHGHAARRGARRASPGQ